MKFKIGDRVRHSGYSLKGLRDYWLSCGREPQKTSAKTELDRKVAERGTITAGDERACHVTWDSGAVSQCLDYMVEGV
jgi:hypothetical protein